MAVSHAQDTTYTWAQTAQGTYSWDDNTISPNNWGMSDGTFPRVSGDIANLNINLLGAQIINLNQTITVGTINLGDTGSTYYATTIAGGTAVSLVMDVSSGDAAISKATAGNNVTDTISASIQLNDNLTVTNASTNASGLLTLSGQISGTGYGLTKEGAGIVRLVGSHLYDGTTTINAGTLQLGNGLASGNASVAGSIANNATLAFNNAEAQSFSGANLSGAGALAKTAAGTLTLNDTTTVGTLNVGFGVNGGTVTVGSGGSLSAGSGSSNNCYIGVSANGGTLNASIAASFTTNVGNLYVGVNTGTPAQATSVGTLSLGADNRITATKIVMGGNEPDSDQSNAHVATVTTAADSATTVTTPYWAVGTSKGTGNLTLGSNATLNLGSSESRTELVISRSDTGNGYNRPAIGNMNLSAGTASLYLSKLVIGRKTVGGNSNNTYSGAGTLTFGTSASNHLDISGAGTVVAIGYSSIAYMGPQGTLTIGNLDATSSITSTDNSTAILLGYHSGTVGSPVTTGTLNLNGGTLTITTTGTAIGTDGSGGISNLNLNGVTLIAGAPSPEWIQGLTNAKIKSGGVVFDTNGNDINIPQVLLEDSVSTAGSLTKVGIGTLTLSGINTYTGDTVVNDGTFVLADNAGLKFVIGLNGVNNQIGGTATVQLDGDFTIDLTGADKTNGNSWTLVEVNTLSETFGTTFNVVGWTESSNVWTLVEGSDTWTFTESDGKLTYTSAGAPYNLWIANYPSLTGDDKLPGADPDHDGQTNQQEFAFGLDPTRGASVNMIIVPLDKVTRQFSYRRWATSGLTYSVWTSTDLQTWAEDTGAVPTPGTTVDGVQPVVVTLSTDPLPDRIFVRVKAE